MPERTGLRRLHAIALLLAAIAAAIAMPACGSTDRQETVDRENRQENITDPKLERPDDPARSREFYRNVLAQLPLRIQPEFQDLSGTDTVTMDGAWLTGLFYRYKGNRKDLYAQFSNNHIYSLRASDMAVEWTVDVEGRPLYEPVVSGEHVFLVTRGPRAVSYFREGQADRVQKHWEQILHVKPCSPPAANDGGLYFGASEYFRVYAFSEDYLRETWFWPHNRSGTGRIGLQPIADDDRLFAYSENGKLYSIDTATGAENWEWPLDATTMVTARPTLRHETIYVGTWDTNLYALDKASKVRWSFPAGEPIVTTPFVVQDRRLNAGDGEGRTETYVFFQTPRYLQCLVAINNEAGDVRLVTQEELREGTARPDEPKWRVPLVPPEVMALRDDRVLGHEARKSIRVLMKGARWVYLLEEIDDQRFLYRVDARTGAFDAEVDPGTNQRRFRRYDVSPFPYIVANDDEENRTLYFGTYEGFFFACHE